MLSAFAASASYGAGGYSGIAAYAACPALWLAYQLFPFDAFGAFRHKDEDEVEGDVKGDTDGLHYDEVTATKGCEMEPYICPKITERVYKRTQAMYAQQKRRQGKWAPFRRTSTHRMILSTPEARTKAAAGAAATPVVPFDIESPRSPAAAASPSARRPSMSAGEVGPVGPGTGLDNKRRRAANKARARKAAEGG